MNSLKVTFRDISAKEPATATATTQSATEVSQEMSGLESSVIGFTYGRLGSPNVKAANHQISELLSSPEVWHFLKHLIQLFPQGTDTKDAWEYTRYIYIYILYLLVTCI